MIIVAGRLAIVRGSRDEFVRESLPAVEAARATPGCLDFVVAADPLDEDRVNIYEEWTSREALRSFRQDGPGAELAVLIESAQVSEHEVNADP